MVILKDDPIYYITLGYVLTMGAMLALLVVCLIWLLMLML